MINPDHFLNELSSRGIRNAFGVPDSLLSSLILSLDNHDSFENEGTTSEGSAIAMALGSYIATNRAPLVYLQNSGIGSITNPVTSLTSLNLYHVPMLLLIGWRAELEESGNQVLDEPQHMQMGEITPKILNDIGIPFEVLSSLDGDWKNTIFKALDISEKEKRVTALLVRKNTFEKYSGDTKEKNFESKSISRKDLIRKILAASAKDSIFVATTGFTSRELYDLRVENANWNNQDFLTVGSMGHAVSVAKGLSENHKDIVLLDGDGSFLMHLGSSIVSEKRPIKHLLLNNKVHLSVGGQKTQIDSVNLDNLAKGLGYTEVMTSVNQDNLTEALSLLKSCKGNLFIEFSVGAEELERSRPEINYQDIVRKIRSFYGHS
jgi:phosphonopyruvate decarboxylase